MNIHIQNLLCAVLDTRLNGCDVDHSHNNPDSFSLKKKKVKDPKIQGDVSPTPHFLNRRYLVMQAKIIKKLHFI